MRFVQALELQPPKTPALEPNRGMGIWTDTLAAYIENHPDTGCILAEIRLYPGNTELIGSKPLKSNPDKSYNRYRYIGEPIARCNACPFKDCISDEWELTGGCVEARKIQRVIGGFYDLPTLPPA